jgi:hypothetical protein
MKFEIAEKEVRGSLLEEILLVMQSGEFEKADNSPEDGNEYLGEMSKLEKALLTIRNRNSKKCEVAIRSDDTWAAYLFKEAAATANKMLWQSIVRRFGREEFDALGIEAPCAIVALSKENLPRHAQRVACFYNPKLTFVSASKNFGIANDIPIIGRITRTSVIINFQKRTFFILFILLIISSSFSSCSFILFKISCSIFLFTAC